MVKHWKAMPWKSGGGHPLWVAVEDYVGSCSSGRKSAAAALAARAQADGLSSYVPEDKIADRCRAMSSAEELCGALLHLALEAGGPDNVTILAARTNALPA